MRFLLVVLLLISIKIRAQQKINFVEIGLNQAIQRAKLENKMVFIDAYAKWCLPCKQMDIEFKNPNVIEYFNKNFINVKVNVDGKYGQEYKQQYQIVFLPSLVLTDFNGKVRTKIDNIISGNELVSVGKYINNKYGPDGNRNIVAVPPRKLAATKPTNSTAQSNNKKTAAPNANRGLISNQDEKILYVMGSEKDNLPPEVLKQEAYFRMELMDGSHISTANSYLATQEDWLTDENMHFIFDFLNDCKSDLFQHVINNRQRYESLLGEDKILTTLNILIKKELDRAFPRPTKEEAFNLYKILNNKNAKARSEFYHLESLYNNGQFEDFSMNGLEYLEDYPLLNLDLTYRICDITIQRNNNKKTLKFIKDKLIDLRSINKENELYSFSLAKTYLKLKNKKRAIDNINNAVSICKSKGINNPEVFALAELLEGS